MPVYLPRAHRHKIKAAEALRDLFEHRQPEQYQPEGPGDEHIGQTSLEANAPQTRLEMENSRAQNKGAMPKAKVLVSRA
eukprot:1157108-Pelagomonas_calceolata.AAC.9